MGNKNILLWVVAVIALVLSTIAIVAPRGQQSEAAVSNLISTQTEVLYQERETRQCTYVNERGGVSIGTREYDPFLGKDMCTGVNGHSYQIKDNIQA